MAAPSYTHDGMSGLDRVLEGHFDLVILDVMLPQVDGFEVLRRLRQQTAVPIIMLTARAAEQDRISGLEARRGLAARPSSSRRPNSKSSNS